MKSASSSTSHFKARLVRGPSVANVQKVAWPSVDQPAEAVAPVALPKNPMVELIHNPDGKDRILVTCTCGKRIEITCET